MELDQFFIFLVPIFKNIKSVILDHIFCYKGTFTYYVSQFLVIFDPPSLLVSIRNIRETPFNYVSFGRPPP